VVGVVVAAILLVGEDKVAKVVEVVEETILDLAVKVLANKLD
jgi:hypothetical protein